MAYDRLSYETLAMNAEHNQTILSDLIRVKDAEIERLKAELKDKYSRGEVMCTVEERDTLRARVEELLQSWAKVDSERDELRTQIKTLTTTLYTTAEEVVELRTLLNESQILVESLEDNCDQYRTRLAEVTKSRDYLKGCAVTDAEIIYQREKTIDELRTQLDQQIRINELAHEQLGLAYTEHTEELAATIKELDVERSSHRETEEQLAESEAERLKGMDYMRMQEKRMRAAESELAAANEKLAAAESASEHRYKWAMAVQAKWGESSEECEILREENYRLKDEAERLAALQPPAPTNSYPDMSETIKNAKAGIVGSTFNPEDFADLFNEPPAPTKWDVTPPARMYEKEAPTIVKSTWQGFYNNGNAGCILHTSFVQPGKYFDSVIRRDTYSDGTVKAVLESV